MASRDAKLRVGLMIHEYIHACFREAVGKSERGRFELGITRGNAGAEAGRRLGLQVHKVNELVQVSMACQLLGGSLEACGQLTWTSLRLFKPFVVRGRIDRGKRSKRQREGEVPCMPSESWHIHEVARDKATELFAQCAAENANWGDVRQRVSCLRECLGLCSRQRLSGSESAGERLSCKIASTQELSCRETPSSPAGAILRLMSRNCSPRDLAELLLEIVQQSDQGVQAAELLLRELPRAMRMKQLLTA